MLLVGHCGGSVEQVIKEIQKLESLTVKSTFVNKAEEIKFPIHESVDVIKKQRYQSV